MNNNIIDAFTTYFYILEHVLRTALKATAIKVLQNNRVVIRRSQDDKAGLTIGQTETRSHGCEFFNRLSLKKYDRIDRTHRIEKRCSYFHASHSRIE